MFNLHILPIINAIRSYVHARAWMYSITKEKCLALKFTWFFSHIRIPYTANQKQPLVFFSLYTSSIWNAFLPYFLCDAMRCQETRFFCSRIEMQCCSLEFIDAWISICPTFYKFTSKNLICIWNKFIYVF